MRLTKSNTSSFCSVLRASQNKEVSVKDRIKAFESKNDHLDVKLRDDGKPRKKKPKSKAFEDFESQGILIGFVSFGLTISPI